MLESYLCKSCRRNCPETERTKCLKNPSLNLGSGFMLLKDCINFDAFDISMGDQRTDIIGCVEDITNIFKPGTFDSIFCAHVLEHFYPADGTKLIADCYTILKQDGMLTMEAPDIEKIINNHMPEQIMATIQEIYGDPKHLCSYGPKWWHKWGWTGQITADVMKKTGFHIRFIGDGISHNKTYRDFRVEGIKR